VGVVELFDKNKWSVCQTTHVKIGNFLKLKKTEIIYLIYYKRKT